jgi:predicted AAA+ superfamily ATPase
MKLLEITYEYIESLKYVKEIKRNIKLNFTSYITSIIGPRRVGKTFIMLKTAKELLSKNKQVIYAPFDEPTLRNLSVREFAKLVRSEYPTNKVYLFLDEIQEWKNWDFNLRWMHDVKDFIITISGSSSTLLSSEIPTRLRGRYLSKMILPLSFSEIVNTRPLTFREVGKIINLLKNYLKYGGFPEIWIYKSRELIISLLETIFYKDIIDRYSIKDVELFKDVFYYLVSNYSKYITFNSISKLFSSRNIQIDTKTISYYYNYIKQSFLLFDVCIFSYSEKKKIVNPKKIYLVDVCFAQLFDNLEVGRLMENLVFLELFRHNYKIYYYKTKNNKEIDFIIKDKTINLIEVTYELDQEHVNKVFKALNELNLKEGLIITWDDEDEIRRNNKIIKVIPLWKWLLST